MVRPILGIWIEYVNIDTFGRIANCFHIVYCGQNQGQMNLSFQIHLDIVSTIVIFGLGIRLGFGDFIVNPILSKLVRIDVLRWQYAHQSGNPKFARFEKHNRPISGPRRRTWFGRILIQIGRSILIIIIIIIRIIYR